VRLKAPTPIQTEKIQLLLILRNRSLFNAHYSFFETNLAITNVAALAAYPVGTDHAITTYLFSKGTHGGWCRNPNTMETRVGMFDTNLSTRTRDLTDGSSNTIAMGEGATGGIFPLCEGQGCTVPASPAAPARQAWIIAQPNSTAFKPAFGVFGSILGSTIDPLNKVPVSETFIDDGALTDCSAATHVTSNFRSYHEGGVQFLLGDGSARMISENLDRGVFNALGTHGGGEVVGEF